MSITVTVCVALLAVQEPSNPALVRLPSGLTVTRAEYRAHLHAAIGGARIEELVYDRILAREVEREIEREGVEKASSDVRRTLADPDAAVERYHTERVARDFGGDRGRFLDGLRAAGVTLDEARIAARLQLVRAARIAALVQAHRAVDDAALRRLFDREYGVDGHRVRVRHVFVPFADARRQLVATGRVPEPDDRRVETMTRKRAEVVWQRVQDGAAFDALGPVEVPNYNYQRFGVPFAEAVRAMRVGEVRGPLRTDFGYHIVRLDARTTTRFADARDELVAQFLRAPPSLAERRALKERLFAEYRVDDALQRRQQRRR